MLTSANFWCTILLEWGDSMYQNNQEQENVLEKYGRNIVEDAKSSKIDPVIGREEEIWRVSEILARRKKNNPILVGEPGVGKTAIAE